MNSTVYTICGAHLEHDGLGNSILSHSRSMLRYKLPPYPRAQIKRFWAVKIPDWAVSGAQKPVRVNLLAALPAYEIRAYDQDRMHTTRWLNVEYAHLGGSISFGATSQETQFPNEIGHRGFSWEEGSEVR